MNIIVIVGLLLSSFPQDTSACKDDFFHHPVPFKMSTSPQFLSRDSVDRIVMEEFEFVAVIENVRSTAVAIATDHNGKVRTVVLNRSSSSEQSDSAAIRAARRFVFRPATYNGHAICAWVVLPIANPKAAKP